MKRNARHRHQAGIGAAKSRHAAVVGARCRVLNFEIKPAVKNHGATQGREDELFFEAEQIERPGAVAGIEGPEGLFFLGTSDETQAPQRFEFVGIGPCVAALPREAPTLSLVHGRARVVDGRKPVPHGGIGVIRQEIRQLHDMAVGIEEAAARGIGHANLQTNPAYHRNRFAISARRRRGAFSASTLAEVKIRFVKDLDLAAKAVDGLPRSRRCSPSRCFSGSRRWCEYVPKRPQYSEVV